MHYANYISAREASRCIRDGVRYISVTRTALKQTHEKTIELLRGNGIKVEEKDAGAGRPRKLNEADIKRVVAIRHSGTSFYKISNLMGIPKSTAFDYCRRFDGAAPKESEIMDVKVEEAHRIFKEIIKRDLDDEVNDLARKGLGSQNIEEIEDVLKEIEIILYC